MDNKIWIQVHDYDQSGRYRIVEDREGTREEALALKDKARESVKLDWGAAPPEFTHIVYYAELLNAHGEPWFASVLMRGRAYTEIAFSDIFQRENVGYVGAFHKLI